MIFYVTLYYHDGTRKSVHPEDLNEYLEKGWITSIERNRKIEEERKQKKLAERKALAEQKERLKEEQRRNRLED